MNKTSKKIFAGFLSFILFLSMFAGLDLKIAQAETYIIAAKIGDHYEIDVNGCTYLRVGGELQLTLQSSRTTDVNPTPTVITSGVTWSSSDTTKATISNTGLVEGVGDTHNSTIVIRAVYKGITYEKPIAVVYEHSNIRIYEQREAYLSGEIEDATYYYSSSQDIIVGDRAVEPPHKDYDKFIFSGWYKFEDTNNNNKADTEELIIDDAHRFVFENEIIGVDDNICVCPVYSNLNTSLISVEFVAVYGENKTIKLDNTYKIEAFLQADEETFIRDISLPNFYTHTEGQDSTMAIVLADDSSQIYLKAQENQNCQITLDRSQKKAHIELSRQQIEENKNLSFKIVFTGAQATYTVNHYKEKYVGTYKVTRSDMSYFILRRNRVLYMPIQMHRQYRYSIRF